MATKKEPAAEVEVKEVAVLVDHGPLGLKCGTVAKLDAEVAESLAAAGVVDLEAKAVSAMSGAAKAGGNSIIEDGDE